MRTLSKEISRHVVCTTAHSCLIASVMSVCCYLQVLPMVLNWVGIRQTWRPIQNNDIIVAKSLTGDVDVWLSIVASCKGEKCEFFSLQVNDKQKTWKQLVLCSLVRCQITISLCCHLQKGIISVTCFSQSTRSFHIHTAYCSHQLVLLDSPPNSCETPTVLGLLHSSRQHSFKASTLLQCHELSCRPRGITKLTPAVRLSLNFNQQKIGDSAA